MDKRKELIAIAAGKLPGYWIEHNSNEGSYCLRHEGDEALQIRHPKDGIKIVGRLLGLTNEQIESLPIIEASKEDGKNSVFLESQDIEMVYSLINR